MPGFSRSQVKSFLKKYRDIYLEGPDWIEFPDVRWGEYKSRTFMLIAWGYAFYQRLFTIPGRMVLIISALVMVYSMTLLTTPIVILAFAMFAVFLVDIVMGFIFRPRLKIERKIPVRVRAGSQAKIIYTVKNLRSVPAWNVAIDALPLRRGIRYTKEPASIACIRGNGTAILETTLCTDHRGRFLMASPLADSAFPFCVFKWSCRCYAPQQLSVYPLYEPLQSVDLPLGRRYQRQGNAMVSNVGESMEFLGCREFRVGDDPKHIHWPTSARLNELIIREFQEEYLSRIALIVDTYIPAESYLRRIFMQKKVYPRFEAALSLTASITDFLSRGDFIVDIFAAGPEVYHFQGGRHLTFFDHILDILSGLEPNHQHPISQLSPSIMEEISSIGSAILILVGWDEERRQLIDQLSSFGVVVKIIDLSDDGIDYPGDSIRLQPDEIMSGKVRNI